MGNTVIVLLVGLIVGITISNMLNLGIFLLLYRYTHSDKTEDNQSIPVIYPLSSGGGDRSLTFADLQRAAAALAAKKSDKAEDTKAADGGGNYI